MKDLPETSKMILPDGADKLLLHSCCAPCSGSVMERLINSGIAFTVFFYNPNIHPRKEYDLRKEENKAFATQKGIAFIDADYDKDNWFERVKGLEFEPERGRRCGICFDIRFERTALFAHENNFKVFTSSLGITRWKDMDQVNTAGTRAAAAYPGLTYWTCNWRKEGGSSRMYDIAKEENFYQQEYCGCLYSLRDSNLTRAKQGKGPIEIGKQYYRKDPA